MSTETRIATVKTYPGIGWVSALRATAIQKLACGGALQMALFDERNLAEITTPEYPGERLVVWYNPISLEIGDGTFAWTRTQAAIDKEAARDQ